MSIFTIIAKKIIFLRTCFVTKNIASFLCVLRWRLKMSMKGCKARQAGTSAIWIGNHKMHKARPNLLQPRKLLIAPGLSFTSRHRCSALPMTKYKKTITQKDAVQFVFRHTTIDFRNNRNGQGVEIKSVFANAIKYVYF